jgi:hypothetical protein
MHTKTNVSRGLICTSQSARNEQRVNELRSKQPDGMDKGVEEAHGALSYVHRKLLNNLNCKPAENCKI